MAKKNTILVVATVLCILVAITSIGFSIEWEKKKTFIPHKQKLSNRPKQLKSSIPAAVSTAKQLHEERLQVTWQEYQKKQKRLDAEEKLDKSPQSISALSQESSWKGWPLEKRAKKTEIKRGLFPPAKIVAPNLNNVNLSPDLSIVSTYPENQSNNVPLNTAISVTFNESLDKYAPLEINLFPSAHSFSDPEISVDGKTISATSALDSNTTYQLMVMAAVTPDSQWIKPQIGATFTTGSSLPTGSIAGNITLPFDPTTNVTFAAVFSTDMMDSEDPYRVADIITGDGSYSVENLRPGDYLLLAVQDINGDLQFNELDVMAFYDADANSEPDIITVSEGQEVSNIDFQLTVFEVVSTYPADSTLNVPTDTTISITFSLPVDFNEEFQAAIFPPPIDQGPLSASPDGKTINIPMILEDSTVYQILVLSAETTAEPEQIQKGPYIAYFSTGPYFPSATISGTVAFADFTPSVAFALLVSTDWEGEEDNIFNVTEINLSDGSYTIINVQVGTYYPAFFADVDGREILVLYSDSVMVMEGEAISNIDMTLALGADITLYGQITGSGGISDVDIEANNTTTEDQDFEAESNFLGYYQTMVSEGLYYLRFDPPENSGYIAKDTTDINITADTELNITLEKGTFIFGTVTNTSGTPISDIYVEVVDVGTQDWVTGGGTNEQGEYRVGVQPGVYDLYFHPWQSRYVATHIMNVIVTADYELDVILQSGSLVDGIVTDKDSTPLEGVSVIAFQTDNWNSVSSTATDEQGYYGIGLLPGTYDIHYDPRWNYSEYLLHVVYDITVPPDTIINVVLDPGSVISGQVTDPEDNPVENAQIEVVDTDYNYISDNWTDGSGNYALTVPYGTYHVRVWPHSGYLASTTIYYVTVPPDTILDIQLRYPQLRTVTGTVKNSSAASMDSVRLDIRNEWTYERNDSTVTDGEGTYAVQLIDGRYTIIFRAGKWNSLGYPNQATSPPIIEIFSDTTIDFTLGSGYNLTGTVTDPVGNPVESADLSFHEPVSYRRIRGSSTDINGNYSTYLVPGSYRMRTIPLAFSNLFMLWSELNFTGTETHDFNLEFIPIHDVGNIVFSWGAGQYGLIWNNGGQGFQYPPGQINNQLHRSYLLIAINNEQISEKEHFHPMSIPNYMVTTPGIISDQDGYTMFDDRWSHFPVGVTVTQNSYTYANDPDDDYVILQLVLRNNDYFTKNIVTGMFFDWDLGDYSDDMGDYDSAHSLGYIYSSDAPDSIHVGTTVLSAGGATSYRVYDLTIEGHLDFEDKYNTLTEGFQQTSTGSGDVRYYIATGPLTLPPASEDSVVVAFAIVAGESLQDLQANTAAAQSKYNTIVSVDDEAESDAIPKIFSLLQNYPNPYNPSTTIKFTLPTPETVKLEVYNIVGQKIETMLKKPMPAGKHDVEFNAQNLSSGVYFYRIEAGEFQDVKKMILIK
jgi:protocatechuate 3,4-dioxygenase beta subunit